MASNKITELLERCVSTEEAALSQAAGGLVPKYEPHQNNPKWIARYGTRPNCRSLGKSKFYTHKLVFHVKEGTLAWLQQFEIKENEPGSFGIPVTELDEFNSRVEKIEVEDIRQIIQKRKKK